MDRDEALRLLRGGAEGVREWNRRRGEGVVIPDLTKAALRAADLGGAVLHAANLRGAVLHGADLNGADLGAAVLRAADLRAADLRRAVLRRADLREADLSEADLNGAVLRRADLRRAALRAADLGGADLGGADLRGANFSAADLGGADLGGAVLHAANLSLADLSLADLSLADLGGADCSSTNFADVDLSEVKGLDSVHHHGPSPISTSTLIRSRGNIPEGFLRGCGLTPWEVLSASLYDTALTPARVSDLLYRIFDAWTKGRSMINGCFISYSWEDAKFVDKLRDRLMDEGVNVWLDRHDMVAGTIQDQVWRAIQIHHVVLLVLSKDSTQSDWVENELDMARRKEKAEGRPVLCPVALDDAWKSKVEAKDGPGDPSRPLWRTLQQKLVVDFSRWETEAFEEAFAKLLRGLKVNYGP